MKKSFITFILLFSVILTSQAQEIAKNTLGVRIGSYDGFAGDLTYQRVLSGLDRLEFNAGYKKGIEDVDSLKFTTLYEWVWYIDNGFYWYIGAGAGVGLWTNDYKSDSFNGEFLFGTGDIGIEYSFCDTPIILSLDFRPEMYFSDYKDANKDNFRGNIGLGAKFRF